MAKQIIYLLRHGQTFWNAEDKKKHQTHSDGYGNLLTEEGIKQAHYAARLLEDVDLDYAFHTPLKRSKQTLDIILKYHPETKISEKPELREMSMSFLDGMTQEDWEREFPETKPLYNNRKKDKFGCKVPEGIDYSSCIERAKQIAEENGEYGKVIPPWENYADVVKRIGESFIPELDMMGDCSIVISGHQGVNRALLGNLLAGSIHLPEMRGIVNLETPNAVIFRVERSQDGVRLYHNEEGDWSYGFIGEKNQ
ncbi:MAG: histidine phosphatase family protein [Candidatus Woesearchaeota archaeon]